MAGKDCPETTTDYREVGRFSRGREGWHTRSGGWSGDGCGGRFSTVPMSGDASKDDPKAYTVWEFSTGRVQSGSCTLSVYVPNSGDPKDVAGSPAHYRVASGNGDLGGFIVDQESNRGRWVSAGGFSLSNGMFAVKMLNRGIDWSSRGPTYEHLAAGQVKVSCQGM